MSNTALTKISEEQFTLSGELTMNTVMQVLAEFGSQIKPQTRVSINFSSVTNSDSAAVALIVAWLVKARQLNINLHLHQLPQQILDIAKASDLLDTLPID